MKIVVEIEVDDIRYPPPGASWAPRPDNAVNELRSITRWAEKHHYSWQNASVTADGTEAWKWESGRATADEIKEMRRIVVMEAMSVAVPSWRRSDSYKERLGTDYRAIVEEYEADPEAPWVKKLRSSIKSGQKRAAKKVADQEARVAEHQATEAQKAELIRYLIKDEDVHQAVLEAQGSTRIDRRRIKEMVMARVMGTAEQDPTPTSPEEELLWRRICRAAEAQSTFALPRRFYMFGHNRNLSFDF